MGRSREQRQRDVANPRFVADPHVERHAAAYPAAAEGKPCAKKPVAWGQER
jgi:hypothetical protein